MKTLVRTLSRRDFLKVSASAFTVLTASGVAGMIPEPPPSDIPIGVQLYCVRNKLKNDFPRTLAALAKMDYQGVEFADYFGHSARDLRRMLDGNGLQCCGSHIYFDDLVGENLKETIAFNRTLGNKYLILRWMPEEHRSSEEEFLKTIDFLNEVAAKVEPHGMRLGYHNHDYIFETFDGEMLWNILADRSRENFILQMDTGNAAHTGVDVIPLLERNAGKTATIHMKPFSSKDDNALIGEDELDWKRILQICEHSGATEWYIIEYEREAYDSLEALELNLDNFRQLQAS